MIIDIDIKIADSKGKLLHRFEKSFDEGFEAEEKPYLSNEIGKNFEDFLSKYMTTSGRMMQEKLHYYQPTAGVTGNAIKDIGHIPACDTDEIYEDREMEYKIRIGKNKLITGIIPLQQFKLLPADVFTHTDTKSTSVNQTDAVSDLPVQKNWVSSNDRDKSPALPQEEVLDKILNHAMVKAIEKYEANLYPPDEEEEEENSYAEPAWDLS